MWISARTAATLASAALLLVMVAVAAPLVPRVHLPSLPEERAEKFGAASAILEAPERVRSQRMVAGDKAPVGGAQWAGFVGSGPAGVPDGDVSARLCALLKDARTVADPRAERAEPQWVVRLVRNDHRVDVMVDADHDRVMVVRDGQPVGGFTTAGLHRDFAALIASLSKP